MKKFITPVLNFSKISDLLIVNFDYKLYNKLTDYVFIFSAIE